MEKYDCEDIKVTVELPDGEKVNLDPFFLKFPVYVKTDETTKIFYFTKDSVVKFESKESFKDSREFFVISKDVCLKDLDKEHMLDIITNGEHIYDIEPVKDSIVTILQARLYIDDLYLNKIEKAIKNKNIEQLDSLLKVISNLTTINFLEINNLKDILDVSTYEKQLLKQQVKLNELLKEAEGLLGKE